MLGGGWRGCGVVGPGARVGPAAEVGGCDVGCRGGCMVYSGAGLVVRGAASRCVAWAPGALRRSRTRSTGQVRRAAACGPLLKQCGPLRRTSYLEAPRPHGRGRWTRQGCRTGADRVRKWLMCRRGRSPVDTLPLHANPHPHVGYPALCCAVVRPRTAEVARPRHIMSGISDVRPTPPVQCPEGGWEPLNGRDSVVAALSLAFVVRVWADR